jgi:two-component system, LytTR family, response regulator
MNAIIIDDEQKSREVLKILLNDYSDITVIAEASEVEMGIKAIQQFSPDVIFLDIKLNAEEGFDILDELPNRNFEIIFVTSYDNYALKAIKYAAFDYLLKPIDLDDLNNAIEKLRTKLQTKTKSNEEDLHIMVHAGNVVKKLEPDEIQYIVADGAYSNIYTNESSYSVSKTLKDIEDLHLHDKKFIRINRGIIVNADFIKEYTKGQYFAITMKDEKVFEVSRRKKAEVLEKLSK